MWRSRRGWLVGTSVLAVVLTASVSAVGSVGASVERVADDPAAARLVLGLAADAPRSEGAPADGSVPSARTEPLAASEPTSYLLVGSDARDGLAGARADVIMLALLPATTTAAPVLVSLPRDLWVEDLCHGGRARLNAALNGCGSDVTGAQLLSLSVEQATGVPVDHYIEFDFAGFEAVIEAVGGIEVCTAVPVRDEFAHLDLPGGCVTPSPDQALAWVRARHLEEFVDGRWSAVPGVDDLSRNQRQQQVLLQVAAALAQVRSPLRLKDLAETLLDVVTVGERLPLDDLVAEAWRWRHLDPAEIGRPTFPVRPATTSHGAEVLLPPTDLRERLAAIVERLRTGDTP